MTMEKDTRPAGTPRWVKVFGIIALVVIVLIAVMFVTGRGGGHGPGRHAPSADDTPPRDAGGHSAATGAPMP